MRRGSSCCLVAGCDDEDLDKLEQKSSLPFAKLENTDLSERDMSGIDFRGACLVGSNLTGSQVTESLLYGADIRRCIGAANYGDVWNCPGRVTSVTTLDTRVVLVLYEWLKNKSIDDILSKADKGDAFYQFAAAFYLESFGDQVDDPQRAFSYYSMAADQNYWAAVNNLGWMYEQGYGVEKSLEEAKKCYDRASRRDVIASFNFIRFCAVYEGDRDACYQLGSLYRIGGSIPADMEVSFHWTKISADGGHVKACRYAGVMNRSGTGTCRDFEEALKYLKAAADPSEDRSGSRGDPEAMFELAVMYESGQSGNIDYSEARYWYQKAASIIDHADAYIHLGKLYEEGKGGPISYEEALQCYKNAAMQGRVTGKYNQGRMLEHFPSPENATKAVELYQEVLQKDPFHTGAQFLLGTHYQRGTGIAKDLQKAEQIYRDTAGHSGAKIRIFLMKHHGDVADAEILEHRQLFEEIAERTKNAEERVHKELEKEEQRCDDQYLHSIFCECKKELEKSYKRSLKEAHMNPLFLPYDPFLADISLLDPIDSKDATSKKIKRIFRQIKAAGRSNPALTSSTVTNLTRVRHSVVSKKKLRERFVRLYNAWMSEDKGFPVPEGVEDGDLYRRGKVAEKLSQNIGRCCDGINNFFSEEEMSFSLDPNNINIPIGLRIGVALVQYKKRFLELHRHPEAHYAEQNTESLAFAYQQMRLPLGLPGVKTSVTYKYLGHSGDEFNAVIMMKRFLRGGKVWNTEIGEYSVENVCSFLCEVIDDPDNDILTKDHISEFVLKDSVLKKAGESAFIEFEENDYCNPFADQSSNPYKHKTLERILALHGYVSGHNPN